MTKTMSSLKKKDLFNCGDLNELKAVVNHTAAASSRIIHQPFDQITVVD